jgi:Zn-dependent peptidase ImmA (M78 family)/DNA-binding XRE family transcriptional regulator
MFGERLKLARKKAGLSLRDLAEKADVSAQALSKYERGLMLPNSGVLTKLCKILDVGTGFFMSPMKLRLANIEYRKHSQTKAREEASVQSQVIDLAEKYLAIEKIVGAETDSIWEKSARIVKDDNADIEVLAQECREHWKLGSDPIPNMTELLEDLGIKVLMVDSDRVSGLTAMLEYGPDKMQVPVVVVSKKKNLEHRRFTLAHELGHRLIKPESKLSDFEKAAHRFASAFLMPRSHIESEFGKHRTAISMPELYDLKQSYRVSLKALVRRLKDLEIINEITYRNFHVFYSQHWKSDIEPKPLEKDEERGCKEQPRRFERLCFWALSEDYVSLSKASELLGKNIETIECMMKAPEACENVTHCH